MLHNSEKKPFENNLASAFLAAAKDIKARKAEEAKKAEEAAEQTEAAAGPAEDIEAGAVRPHDVRQPMVDNFQGLREGRGFIPIQVYEARYEEWQRNKEEKAKKVEADILKAEKAKADRTQLEKEEDEAKLAEAIQNIDDFMGVDPDLYNYDDADPELAGYAADAGPTLSFPYIERLKEAASSRVLSPEEIRILAEHSVSESSENLTQEEILARIERTFHRMVDAQSNEVFQLYNLDTLTYNQRLIIAEHKELYPEYYPDAAEQDDVVSPEFTVMSEDEMRILAEKTVYDAVDKDKGRGVNATQEEILVRIEETLQSMLDDQFNMVVLFYHIQSPTEAQERAMREHLELYPEEYELVEVNRNTGEYYPVAVDPNTGEYYSEGADAADVIEREGVHCAGAVHTEETG